jgi:hypothetical protein
MTQPLPTPKAIVTDAQLTVVREWIDGGFRVPNCAERVALRAVLAAASPVETVTVDEALRIADEAIDKVFDHSERTFAVLVEGLHAQIFGVYSLGDPQLSHAALADGGQIHEAAHALVRALPPRANPEASEIMREALDTTPTGALGLPRWKYELRAAAACMNVDAPLSLAYRKYLAGMFGKLERAIEALSSICKGEQ